jgi:hypothetical protein
MRRLSRTSFCNRHECFGESGGVDDIRIEVLFFEFGKAFVIGCANRLEKLGVAPRAADVFLRAASGGSAPVHLASVRV